MEVKRFLRAYQLISLDEAVCTKKTPRSFYFDIAGHEVVLTHYWDETGVTSKEIYKETCTCKEMTFPVSKKRECEHILAAKVLLTSIYGPPLRQRWKSLTDKASDIFNLMSENQKKEFLEKCQSQ